MIRDPGTLYRLLAAQKEPTWVVLDEIQKVPALDEVQRLLDRPDNPLRFALTGSSARKLRRGSANLLAGRALTRRSFPFTVHEMAEEFELDRALASGTLPGIWTSPEDADDLLLAYADTYLQEEVREEALVRDIGSFARFLRVAALMNGQTPNLSSISRDVGASRMTVERYFEVLNDTLVGAWLPAWRPRVKVKEASSPKFYLFDPGVARALAGTLSRPPTPDERGPLLEALIYSELRAFLQDRLPTGNLNYWRTPNGSEVDFILDLGDRVLGIEVNTSPRYRSEEVRPLRELRKSGILHEAIVVYGGQSDQLDGEIRVLTVSSFARWLRAEALTPQRP